MVCPNVALRTYTRPNIRFESLGTGLSIAKLKLELGRDNWEGPATETTMAWSETCFRYGDGKAAGQNVPWLLPIDMHAWGEINH